MFSKSVFQYFHWTHFLHLSVPNFRTVFGAIMALLWVPFGSQLGTFSDQVCTVWTRVGQTRGQNGLQIGSWEAPGIRHAPKCLLHCHRSPFGSISKRFCDQKLPKSREKSFCARIQSFQNQFFVVISLVLAVHKSRGTCI